jgi:uncharacterized protein (TIGR03435 family)
MSACLLTVFAATAAALAGQSFEVAAIRPHDPTKNAVGATAGGRFYASLTLKYMIQVAYDVAPCQISGGPDWLDKETWDITAKAQGFSGEIPFEQLRPMLRELIRDRFRLKLQSRKQELPYFALLVDRKGSKLKPSTSDVADFQLQRGPVLTWTRVSMRSFASWLQPWIQSDRVVLDETGLPGEYDLQLRWAGQRMTAAPLTPEASAQLDEAAGPTIFTALREQLGLRLESRRGPIETLVVENAERPSEN